jgi:hypothetical protein
VPPWDFSIKYPLFRGLAKNLELSSAPLKRGNFQDIPDCLSKYKGNLERWQGRDGDIAICNKRRNNAATGDNS